jgi:hypothetical protein
VQEVKDGSNDSEQVQQRLAAHETASTALMEWMGAFHKLRRPVDGSGGLQDVLGAVADVATSITRAMAAAASAKNAAAAAVTAQQVRQSRRVSPQHRHHCPQVLPYCYHNLIGLVLRQYQGSVSSLDAPDNGWSQPPTTTLKIATGWHLGLWQRLTPLGIAWLLTMLALSVVCTRNIGMEQWTSTDHFGIVGSEAFQTNTMVDGCNAVRSAQSARITSLGEGGGWLLG